MIDHLLCVGQIRFVPIEDGIDYEDFKAISRSDFEIFAIDNDNLEVQEQSGWFDIISSSSKKE